MGEATTPNNASIEAPTNPLHAVNSYSISKWKATLSYVFSVGKDKCLQAVAALLLAMTH